MLRPSEIFVSRGYRFEGGRGTKGDKSAAIRCYSFGPVFPPELPGEWFGAAQLRRIFRRKPTKGNGENLEKQTALEVLFHSGRPDGYTHGGQSRRRFGLEHDHA